MHGQQKLFKQGKRLADAERILQTKPTKKISPPCPQTESGRFG